MEHNVVDTLIAPEGKLEVLSKAEVGQLLDSGKGAERLSPVRPGFDDRACPGFAKLGKGSGVAGRE